MRLLSWHVISSLLVVPDLLILKVCLRICSLLMLRLVACSTLWLTGTGTHALPLAEKDTLHLTFIKFLLFRRSTPYLLRVRLESRERRFISLMLLRGFDVDNLVLTLLQLLHRFLPGTFHCLSTRISLRSFPAMCSNKFSGNLSVALPLTLSSRAILRFLLFLCHLQQLLLLNQQLTDHLNLLWINFFQIVKILDTF